MKILVLGGAGYIGSVLCPYLQAQGDEVVVFDNLLYGSYHKTSITCGFVHGDIRDINKLAPLIDRADAIVNLAAISNDPASDLQPLLTWEINYKANELVAKLCQSANKRIVYVSTCSVYGFSERGVFNEESRLNPVTLYARTKLLAEEFYLHKQINAIILRLATVYGSSPKPRFDLVVNSMIGTSYFNGKITVNGGEQWRPIIHVKDVVRVISTAVRVIRPVHRIYNVGSDQQNIQIRQLAVAIVHALPWVEIDNKHNCVDNRSYQVDFKRIHTNWQFVTEFNIYDAINELYTAFRQGIIRNMGEDEYYRVKYLAKKINGERLKHRIINSKAVKHILAKSNLWFQGKLKVPRLKFYRVVNYG